ncbi:MAG: protein-L-isoaspartate(D-aspartate) O-methyltransferase [Deltaproteobacteria bacterium]|nr:protein-L-isoaspartate(D-aspartate) O-methyltransferase [Deltaproteobacteria bacterium]
MPCPARDIDFELLRLQMVEQQLQARGISDASVLRAMRTVPREVFVPDAYRHDAYRDAPLPIGSGQTISQPYIVALMTELLRLTAFDRVLEIGTGSGYQAAVLATITPHVYSVERIDRLAQGARKALNSIGLPAVRILTADGTHGWPEHAPFDAIIVTSGAPGVPEPLKLQLAEHGRLVIPSGTRYSQTLFLIERRGKDFTETEHGGCVFVPLVGRHGWSDDS